MNKTELIEKLASDLDVSKALASQFLASFQTIITDELAEDRSVAIIGFGTFSPKHRDARTGRNPSTGKEMQLAASRTPSFKAGKTFKDAVAL